MVNWTASPGWMAAGFSGVAIREWRIFSAMVMGRAGVLGTGSAASPRALRAVQAAFDRWQAESGLTLNQISAILAQSIGPAE